MASEAAQKLSEKFVQKVLMPAISAGLTKAGASVQEKNKVYVNLVKLFTDQLALALDLCFEAKQSGGVSPKFIARYTFKKFGATSAFWGSDVADCMMNVALLALSIGEAAITAVADVETFGALTGALLWEAVNVVSNSYAASEACKIPFERAKEEVNTEMISFSAQFLQSFNAWIVSQGGVALPSY